MNEKTYPRIILALTSAVIILLAAVGALYLTRNASNDVKPETSAPPQTTPAAPKTSPTAATGADPHAEKESERLPGPIAIEATSDDYAKVAQAFMRAYTTPAPRKQWLDALKPYSGPAFYASLADSDIELSKGLGTEIIHAEPGTVIVGKNGQAQAVLTMHAISDEGELLPPVVEAIDYGQEPDRNAQPPLSSKSRDSVKENLQLSMAYLIGQEATLTDQERNERLQLAFVTPKHVLEIPRVAPAGTPVQIGNITDLQFLATPDNQLTALIAVPWRAEGQKTQWVTHTVLLARAGQHSWQAADIIPDTPEPEDDHGDHDHHGH
ncbi:hypothetical protein KRX56_01605 [Dermabacteraceae bacterium TAE3-ERU27]|nr:hypothetical protein [Dermabacteraceae bacterium TAE3-ERU27]